ncbi:hypothetical protein KKB18_00690, partial [bacterium]|nr:hypothetical protein [bacterium]
MRMCIFAIALLVVNISFLNAQSISINVDKGEYNPGDTVHVFIGVSNGPEHTIVDLYYVLLKPNNDLLFFPSWAKDFSNVPNIPLVPNFNLPESDVFQYNLPSMFPPINETGNYTFAVGLTNQGTLDFLSIDSVSFHYTASTGETQKYASLKMCYGKDYSDAQVTDYLAVYTAFS